MADRDQEARLRDLKKRVEREPRSRFFVPLAEEYRKAGRLPEAIQALEDGLVAHPAYVAARVALARAYLEVGRIEESMTAFSKVLADDPSNLVAAKALGDIHLSRGEPMEALKRYLRFRAVSGDRRMDEVIAKLREETGPEPDAAPAPPLAPPAGPALAESAEQMLSRDVRLDGIPSRARSDDEEIITRKIRLPEATWPFEPVPEEPPLPAAVGPPEATASGRTLAELYFEQGHPHEALRLADELLLASPGDEGLRRLRDESADRLAAPAPAPATVPAPVQDAGRERRLSKIRLLNQWLAAVEKWSRP